MNVSLHFSTAQSSMNKVATFQDLSAKQAYTHAETHDFNCKQAWFHHQASKTLAARKVTAEILDATRYAFYTRWNKQNGIKPGFPPLRPVDGGYPA